ncbi:uncharacterized protein ARMOST_00108 [Armillaria ostoyae]|uniref:Uncharacterized protein n=1 Tax=Armillaria ostoyae TaxID=47428 RepID=A0A284QK81_ARMOS|nr:uncharacterized protein ARMOST_00108 [Armillaria ostoyae]
MAFLLTRLNSIMRWEDELARQQQEEENREEPVALENIGEQAPMSRVERSLTSPCESQEALTTPAYPESHREADMPGVLVSVIKDERDKVWARILFIMYPPDF